MKIKVNQILKNYDGTNYTETKQKNGKVEDVYLTIREIWTQALEGTLPNETRTAEDKASCFQLAKKLYMSNNPDISDFEEDKLKERVDKVYQSPMINGRTREVLKTNAQEVPDKKALEEEEKKELSENGKKEKKQVAVPLATN